MPWCIYSGLPPSRYLISLHASLMPQMNAVIGPLWLLRSQLPQSPPVSKESGDKTCPVARSYRMLCRYRVRLARGTHRSSYQYRDRELCLMGHVAEPSVYTRRRNLGGYEWAKLGGLEAYGRFLHPSDSVLTVRRVIKLTWWRCSFAEKPYHRLSVL